MPEDTETAAVPDDADTTDAASTNDSASAADDFNTDMQTIHDYVQAIVEAKAKIATAHLAAIDNFQTTVTAASPAEAKPDFLAVVLKAGLKAAEKATAKAVEEATGVEIGPLIDLFHAISDEVDRAAKAAQSLAVAEWIKSIRASVTDAYTQDQTGAALREAIETEYNQHDAGGRGGYIAGIENEMTALKSLSVPETRALEAAMYVSWINQNFNNDCMDGTGLIYIQFDDDGTLSSATVQAPLGDKIAAALNNTMGAAGTDGLMGLDVVKKSCRGTDCMCFEGNNVVRKAATSDATQEFLSAPDTWKQLSVFTTT